MVLLLAFLIGGVCGLCSMTGPAVVCWGAHLGWLQLHGSKLGFLHNLISLAVFTLFAAGEIIADKQPKIPSRIMPGPLVVRCIFGAICAEALCISGGAKLLVAWPLGAVGAAAGAYVGYHVRRRRTVGQGLPDILIALFEDAVAVGGGLMIVSRF
jgi:uncharacterized membrane protein